MLVNGTLGDHGMAVLCARQGIGIRHGPISDSAPVHRLVAALAPIAPQVRFLRDPTRGGVAAVTNEIVEGRPVGVRLREATLPFAPGTRAAAELLGLDLLDVACEGRVLAMVAADAADAALAAWRALPEGAQAAQIGVVDSRGGQVSLETLMGGHRLVDVPQGEVLPRIC